MRPPTAATPPPPSGSAPPGFPLKRLAINGAFLIVFCVACSVVTWALSGGPFLGNLFGSISIGTIAFLIIDGTRLALWADSAERRPPLWILASIVLCAIPVAQYLGSLLWSLLHGTAIPDLAMLFSQRMLPAYIFSLFASVLFTTFIVTRDQLFGASASAAREKARAESIERQALQAQLQLLQAQLEPHMLFNTLSNLQGLIAIDPARAQHMLDQLIQYLRATLSSSRAGVTTLAQEFALMEAYLGLMSVRMGERLSYTLTLPENLNDTAIPPMLLQPLVENAIQHGLEPKIEGGHIAVSAQRDGDMLCLRVDDTGLGPDALSNKSGTRLGLANTRERLHALYGARATFSLDAVTSGGAVARLTLPLQGPDYARTNR